MVKKELEEKINKILHYSDDNHRPYPEETEAIINAFKEYLLKKQVKFNTNGKDRTHEQAINETNYQRTKRHIRNKFIKELLAELS